MGEGAGAQLRWQPGSEQQWRKGTADVVAAAVGVIAGAVGRAAVGRTP